jgi:GTP-binding protein
MVDNQTNNSKITQLSKTLFSSPCNFVLGAKSFSEIKQYPFPEIAFWGRSNVGKSSLINGVMGRKVARTSNTPGRTQQLNFFSLGDRLMVVDMPGYGFAEVPLKVKQQWEMLISQYLKCRDQLKRLFLLVDARHGLKKNDLEIMDFLDEFGIIYQIVLTKSDKVNKLDQEVLLANISNELTKHPAAIEQIVFSSASKQFGMNELRQIIAGLLLN